MHRSLTFAVIAACGCAHEMKARISDRLWNLCLSQCFERARLQPRRKYRRIKDGFSPRGNTRRGVRLNRKFLMPTEGWKFASEFDSTGCAVGIAAAYPKFAPLCSCQNRDWGSQGMRFEQGKWIRDQPCSQQQEQSQPLRQPEVRNRRLAWLWTRSLQAPLRVRLPLRPQPGRKSRQWPWCSRQH